MVGIFCDELILGPDVYFEHFMSVQNIKFSFRKYLDLFNRDIFQDILQLVLFSWNVPVLKYFHCGIVLTFFDFWNLFDQTTTKKKTLRAPMRWRQLQLQRRVCWKCDGIFSLVCSWSNEQQDDHLKKVFPSRIKRTRPWMLRIKLANPKIRLMMVRTIQGITSTWFAWKSWNRSYESVLSWNRSILNAYNSVLC